MLRTSLCAALAVLLLAAPAVAGSIALPAGATPTIYGTLNGPHPAGKVQGDIEGYVDVNGDLWLPTGPWYAPWERWERTEGNDGPEYWCEDDTHRITVHDPDRVQERFFVPPSGPWTTMHYPATF